MAARPPPLGPPPHPPRRIGRVRRPCGDSYIVSGLLFSGTAAPGRSTSFTQCTFKGGSTGTVGTSTSTTAWFYNVQFVNCTVTENLGHGVSLMSAALKSFSFANCQVRGNSYLTSGSGAGYN